MPNIFKGKDILGRRIVRVDNYEICKSSGKWEIVKLAPYARWSTYISPFGDKTPSFPNMMQAYRFLKENWATID